jgi:hypothetical protein
MVFRVSWKLGGDQVHMPSFYSRSTEVLQPQAAVAHFRLFVNIYTSYQLCTLVKAVNIYLLLSCLLLACVIRLICPTLLLAVVSLLTEMPSHISLAFTSISSRLNKTPASLHYSF